ncbi:MAG: hypothetical protein HFI31_05705 [Lachnospiraceae bacterium]|jgi:hypothetical protein|nr:hypothetical protein [Lachnospiraceae bacterium]MCI8994746.1 hypothetical protein [Lachnospiraceae bacterium]MCI9133669.1 hypothetical protein [Lachnospiraceae bacterium]
MNQFVVGIDLKDTYAQISYWKPGAPEPESLSMTVGEERYEIPGGSPEEFLKKALRLLRPVGKLGSAAAVVFSVKHTDEETVERVKTAAMRVGILEERLYVQSDQESFCSYVMHQPKDIHSHHVAMFSYEQETLGASLLVLNQKRIPILARVEEQEDWEIPDMEELSLEERDAYFASLILRVFDQRIVSAAYLVGEGFSERWYEKSLQLLCAGRRVFAGNNLFAKGACYRAAELAGEEAPSPYLYFGDDKIPCNVGLCAVNSGRDGLEVLIPAGVNWYEAKAECEVLLCEQPIVEIVFQPLLGDASLKESILLDGLPERPPRTTRLGVEAAFTKKSACRVRIWDLGFGELYPATNLTWEEEVDV